VRADGRNDLVRHSTVALDEYWSKLARMYGERGIVGKWLCSLDGEGGLTHLADAVAPTVDDLIENAVQAVAFDGRGGAR
jgi:hypothetical protein